MNKGLSICGFLWLMSLTGIGSSAVAADNQQDTEIPDPPAQPYSAGHGWTTIKFEHLYSHGDYDGPAGPDSGNVHFFSMQLSATYFVADNWDIHLGIPYITGQLTGKYFHPQLPCVPSNCVPTKIDDGNYHGDWQDWDGGVAYHTDINGYEVSPSIDLYIPSNNYPFYGTGIGQRNPHLGLGADVTHQLQFSDLFFEAHAQYVFNHHVIHIDNDYYTFGVDLGYFINPEISVRAISDVKLGDGFTDLQISSYAPFAPPPLVGNATEGANPIWELHDKFRLQEHADVGAGLDYEFGRNKLTVTAAHSVWGRSNSRLTFDLGLALTRSF